MRAGVELEGNSIAGVVTRDGIQVHAGADIVLYDLSRDGSEEINLCVSPVVEDPRSLKDVKDPKRARPLGRKHRLAEFHHACDRTMIVLLS